MFGMVQRRCGACFLDEPGAPLLRLAMAAEKDLDARPSQADVRGARTPPPIPPSPTFERDGIVRRVLPIMVWGRMVGVCLPS